MRPPRLLKVVGIGHKIALGSQLEMLLTLEKLRHLKSNESAALNRGPRAPTCCNTGPVRSKWRTDSYLRLDEKLGLRSVSKHLPIVGLVSIDLDSRHEDAQLCRASGGRRDESYQIDSS